MSISSSRWSRNSAPAGRSRSCRTSSSGATSCARWRPGTIDAERLAGMLFGIPAQTVSPILALDRREQRLDMARPQPIVVVEISDKTAVRDVAEDRQQRATPRIGMEAAVGPRGRIAEIE